MSETLALRQYYDRAQQQGHRPLLEWAASLNQSECLTAVDCGCGTGNDTAFLVSKGYRVQAFDISAESINRCRDRFEPLSDVELHQCGFEDFSYPRSGVLVAHSSLFFCPCKI
ncbi:MAG: class I SAM-dependent methyltransferase [Oceanospirillaceae bacterium]|nr:class I SAM-dependent methyltransferase [Oceanospirillaceae bacterium]